jgi:hypothetical protein
LLGDDFEVIGEITDIGTIAINTSIREVKRLPKMFGRGRWRKLKGIATVRLPDGVERRAESIVSKIRGGGSLTGPGLSRKMWGRKIRPRRLSAIFLPGIFRLPPIFERIPRKYTGTRRTASAKENSKSNAIWLERYG